MTQLQRTTFETSRAAEYFDGRQLSALTGVPQTEFASVCLKELVDNALDACETAGVAPQVGIDVRAEQDVIGLTVSDNGPGIPPEVVKKVLDYNIRVSDKAAYRSPTRGAQGNALKTIIGIPYALGSREPLVVSARGVRHQIAPWVDPAGAVHFDYSSSPRPTEGTAVSLTMPSRVMATGERGYYSQEFDPVHWCRSFAAFNPHATISYRLTAKVQNGPEFPNTASGRSASGRALTRLRAPTRKRPKLTNLPTRAPSRSTYRASRQARTGIARSL